MDSTLEKRGKREKSHGAEQDGLSFMEKLEASKTTYRKPVEQSREVLAEAVRRREARKKPQLPAKDEERGDAPAGHKSAVPSSRPRPNAEAAPEGERNYDWLPCLLCMGKNLPCSFVHNRSAGSDLVCTCCERLGEGVFCIQIATARAGRYYGVDEVTLVQMRPAGWRSDGVGRQHDMIEVFVPIPDLRYSPDKYAAFVQTAEFLINGEPGPLVADRLSDGLMLTDTGNWALPLWWNTKNPKPPPPVTGGAEEESPAWRGYFQQLQQQRKDWRDGQNKEKTEDAANVGDHSANKKKGQREQESDQKKTEPEPEADNPLAYTSSGRVLQHLYREREKMKKYAEAFEQAKKEKEAKMAEAERMTKRGLIHIDYDSTLGIPTDSSSDS
ncbi:hypothetical protein PspLS_00488 [Pyricularia sp. CBS 133598]|nr:hypothetical protein PspLS_00488 [Pyricularia sp. CBS 133598]